MFINLRFLLSFYKMHQVVPISVIYFVLKTLILFEIVHLKASADVSEFFDSSLTIEIPNGTFFSGEKVKFICTAQNYEGDGPLIWQFTSDSGFQREIYADPENDFIDHTEKGLRRTSYIDIFDPSVISIGCNLLKDDHWYNKSVPIRILGSAMRINNESADYPQIVLERFGPYLAHQDNQMIHKSRRYPPHIVTNQSIGLSPDIKSIKLSCIIRPQDEGLYEWTLSSGQMESTPQPTSSVLLNQIALIQHEAISAGRLPSPSDCESHNITKLFRGKNLHAEVLEVIISPNLQESQNLTYACQSKKQNSSYSSSNVRIAFFATKNTVTDQDREFLDLVHVLMQILQSSSDGGSGGSGSLYGVGFGSSTIMILMALTIYYLKKQLKQLQDQVNEHERKRLKKNDQTSDETDTEL